MDAQKENRTFSPGTDSVVGGAKSTSGRSASIWEVLGRIWAFWVILIFVLTMLLFFIPFLLFCYFRPDPQKTRRFVRYSRVWMSVFLPLAGCPLRIKGKDKFRKGETYIVLFNHNALMDVPVSCPAVPGGNKTIAKIEMARVPLFGMLYRTGSVLVDRNNKTSRGESYVKMKEALDMGLHMSIYPEGTRNKTPQPLKEFHDGAFRLSISTGKSIIPSLIFHTRKIMPSEKSFFFKPHRIEMHFLDPIAPQTDDTEETLKQRVFRVMWDHYTSNS